MAETGTFLDEIQRKIYRRNLLLPEIGEQGQARLLASSVLIVGLGGLGSPALYYLASSGVGRIGLLDGDRVDLSNLQRQILYGHPDLGREKAPAAAERIRALRPDLRIDLHTARLDETNAADLIAPYDFVIEATDSFESKFLVNDACVRQQKPFSHAGVLRGYGQALTVVPGKGPCFRCVFGKPPDPGAVEDAADAGVLATLPGVFGAIQATEAIKVLLGCGRPLVGRLLTWDAFDMTFREIRLPAEPHCAVCSHVFRG